MNVDDHAQLASLGRHLDVHGFKTDLTDDHLTVTEPKTDTDLTIRCGPRASDSGRSWFFADAGVPLAEADQIVNAITAVKSLRRVS